jgi:hypothetical protein
MRKKIIKVMERTCSKCGNIKSRKYFTTGYFWCNKCLGKESKIPEYSKEELSNPLMQLCNMCKYLMPKEYFDLRKFRIEIVPRYGKVCIICKERIKDRIQRREKTKEERHRKIRNMMLNLKYDEIRKWAWENQQGLQSIQSIVKGGYYNLYLNKIKDTRTLVETKTIQIKLNQLIKEKNENNYRFKK